MTDKNEKKKRRKDKKSRKSPIDDIIDDDEEPEGKEFNQMDIFQKMMENFGKQMGGDFYKMVNALMRQFDPNMKEMSPEEIQKMMKENLKHFKISPFVFGGTMTPGADGKPKFERFNTTRSSNQQEPENDEGREPLVDIMEEEEEIIVVAEIPGCAKENIELDTTDMSLTITACDEDNERKYKTTVDLPSKINPDHARARYRNGILEVKLEKVKGRNKSKKISIE
ncbi:MAG: Hsp20 family protein [Promethearchaeota archaeon]|nr:MAG: Hsp20 family protein [Candidatus Lokiarchaeota archaeon]